MTNAIAVQVMLIIVSGLFTLLIAGIGWLIYGQSSIRKEAEAGRKVLHNKFEELKKSFEDTNNRLLKIETEHHINHHGGK